MRTTARAALAITGVLVLCACADTSTRPMPTPVLASSAAPGASSTPQAGDTAPAPSDELAKGSARHTVRSNGLTVTVGYAVQTPAHWAADAGTSLQLSVSARDDGSSARKVYLSKATLSYATDDGSASLPAPDPVVDNANLNPGFLVTSPNQYVQLFGVPPVDRATRDLTLAVKLEFVTLVDKKAKDYTKRTVTDRVQTVVSG